MELLHLKTCISFHIYWKLLCLIFIDTNFAQIHLVVAENDFTRCLIQLSCASPKVSKCPSGCRLQGLISQMENDVEKKQWTACKMVKTFKDAAEKSMLMMTHIYNSNRRVIVNRYSWDLPQTSGLGFLGQTKPDFLKLCSIFSYRAETGGPRRRSGQEPDGSTQTINRSVQKNEGAEQQSKETTGGTVSNRGE